MVSPDRPSARGEAGDQTQRQGPANARGAANGRGDAAAAPPYPETGPAAPRRRRFRLAVVLLVLAILTVEVIIGGPSLADAVAQLRTPHYGWLAGAVAVEVASMGVFARMQRRLLRSAGTRLPLGRHVALAFAAHSLSVTLPGGPVFSTTFNFQQLRRFGASSAVASWCIALSAVLSASALLIISAGGAIMAQTSGGWATLVGYLSAAAVVAVGVRLLAQHPEFLTGPAQAVLSRLNRVRRRPADQGRERITTLVEQLWAVRIRPADFVVACAFALANWLFDALCLWMCCRAVGADDITGTELVIAYCAGMAAASIPIVPGGLGVVDGALIVGLVAGGLHASAAIAAVVLYRLISLGFIIAAGWVFWLVMRYAQGYDASPDEEAAARQASARPSS